MYICKATPSYQFGTRNKTKRQVVCIWDLQIQGTSTSIVNSALLISLSKLGAFPGLHFHSFYLHAFLKLYNI